MTDARAERQVATPERLPAEAADSGPLAVDPDALLDALFRLSPLAKAVYDEAGRVVATNEAFTRLTGIAAADIAPDYSLLTDRELHRLGVLSDVRRAFAGETVTLPPLRYGMGDPAGMGATTWMRAHLHPLRDAQGSVTHVLMTHVDVTVHLSGPDESSPPATSDPTAGRAGSLLAVMSHELRTPLNAIMGYTELLRTGVGGGELSGTQGAHLERIRLAARQLGQLVDMVLAYARLEAGEADVACELVDVSTLVTEAVEAVAATAALRGLELALELPAAVQLETDPGKVTQVLSSLLSNAVKFTEQGTIRVGVRDQDDVVLISVADTGIGIRDADLTKVFEPFKQIDSTLTRRVDGAGIGLALAARLARLLGGGITVDSQTGRGSTFTLCLPRAAHQS